MVTVTNEQELSKALKNNEKNIMVVDNKKLINSLIRFSKLKKPAIPILITSLAIATTGIVTSATGIGAPIGMIFAAVAAPAAVSIVGIETTIVLILLIVAFGSILVIAMLKDYNIEVYCENGRVYIILTKK